MNAVATYMAEVEKAPAAIQFHMFAERLSAALAVDRSADRDFAQLADRIGLSERDPQGVQDILDLAGRRADDDRAGRDENAKGGKAVTTRFPLVRFDHIAVDTKRRGYLVKGLLSSTGLAVIWGPPKCGKSFWAVNIGMHIALGWEYRGRRVQQAPVVYVALEGQHGQPARLEGFRRYHGVTSAPFYLMTVRLNLIADASALATAIKTQLGDVTPGAVFLDTLNRSLVGSESKDEDMGKYLAAAEKLADELNALVAIVHHCGIDATRPRGHTSLTGSVEVQIAVKRADTGEVVATVEFAKDMPEGAEVFSRLEPMTVGTDPDGDDITTLVVLPTDQPAPVRTGKVVKGAKKVALDLLRKAIDECGEAPAASNHIPSGSQTISVETWRRVQAREC